MAVTKKVYVDKVVPLMQKNVKSIFTGHKIPPAILTMIENRPDVCAKLAVFGYNTINWKKGDKSLKRNDQFKITGYKNYMDFAKNSMTDISKFQETLPAKDKKSFLANENVNTLIIVPDTATSDLDADIINLTSSVVTYGASLDKKYSSLGAIFITIAYGTSYILPKTTVRAERQEKLNKKINLRRTPAKVKAELDAKHRAKLAIIKEKGNSLEAEKAKLSAELKQLNTLDSSLGGNAKDFDTANKEALKANLAELSVKEKKMYNDIAKYRADGKNAIADAIEADFKNIIKNKSGANILTNKPSTSKEIIGDRKASHEASLLKLKEAVATLEERIASAPNAKIKSSLNFTLRQKLSQIDIIEAKLGVHKSANKITDTIAKKQAKLDEINKKIEDNFNAGMTLKEAMNKAVSSSNVDKETIAELSTDLKAEVTNGLTQEEAIMQVFQPNVSTSDTRVSVNDGVAFAGRKVYGVNTAIGEETGIYSVVEEIYSTPMTNTEYFVNKENADTFASEMNALSSSNSDTKTYEINDGFVKSGENVFGVDTEIGVGENYIVFTTSFNPDSPNTTTEYFIKEENADTFASEMNETLIVTNEVPDGSFQVNDGYVKEGDRVFGVDTDIMEGDVYEYFSTNFNPNSPNTTTEYFITEANAQKFQDEMNSSLVSATPQDETNMFKAVDAYATYGESLFYVYTNNETGTLKYDMLKVPITKEFIASAGINPMTDLYFHEENAKNFITEKNTELGVETIFVNDGTVNDGDYVYSVNTAPNTEVYKVEQAIFDITKAYTYEELFLSEEEATNFADGMNQSLFPTQDYDYVTVDGTVNFGDMAWYVFRTETGTYEMVEIQIQKWLIDQKNIDTESELFVDKENAELYVNEMNTTDQSNVDQTYKIYDGFVKEGDNVFGVDMDIDESNGETYEAFSTVYNPNSPNTTTTYFISESNAENFINQIHLDKPIVAGQVYAINDGNVSDGDKVYSVKLDNTINKYYISDKLFNSLEVDESEELFIDSKNAESYAVSMNGTLPKFPVEDGEIGEGDVVYYVDRAVGSEIFTVFEEYYIASKVVKEGRHYFVSQDNAIAYANELNTQNTDQVSYDINGGSVHEGDSVFGVDTEIGEDEQYEVFGTNYNPNSPNLSTEYFVNQDDAILFANELNTKLLSSKQMYPVNDGEVAEGDTVYGVDTDIMDGDIYEYFSTYYNPNSPNTTTVYFVSEDNAKAYQDEMNSTLTGGENTIDDINDILSFL